jgi:hypothetical protein
MQRGRPRGSPPVCWSFGEAFDMKSHPEVEVNLARTRKEHKSLLHWTRLLASAEPLQPLPRGRVELPGKAGRSLVAVLDGGQLAEERL